jgi:hypothetical protein
MVRTTAKAEAQPENQRSRNHLFLASVTQRG